MENKLLVVAQCLALYDGNTPVIVMFYVNKDDNFYKLIVKNKSDIQLHSDLVNDYIVKNLHDIDKKFGLLLCQGDLEFYKIHDFFDCKNEIEFFQKFQNTILENYVLDKLIIFKNDFFFTKEPIYYLGDGDFEE